MFVTPCVSHDTCHLLHVTYQVSGVTCQVSHVNSNSQTVKARELTIWVKVHLLPPVTCLMSCVTYNMSHVTFHVSHVTCKNLFCCFYLKKKNENDWSYSVNGLISTGPTLSSIMKAFSFLLQCDKSAVQEDCRNWLKVPQVPCFLFYSTMCANIFFYCIEDIYFWTPCKNNHHTRYGIQHFLNAYWRRKK